MTISVQNNGWTPARIQVRIRTDPVRNTLDIAFLKRCLDPI